MASDEGVQTAAFLFGCLAIAAALGAGIAYTQVTPPSRLPNEIISVGPNNTFVVEKGYGPLGAELCKDAEFFTQGLPHERELVACEHGSNSFTYPFAYSGKLRSSL